MEAIGVHRRDGVLVAFDGVDRAQAGIGANGVRDRCACWAEPSQTRESRTSAWMAMSGWSFRPQSQRLGASEMLQEPVAR